MDLCEVVAVLNVRIAQVAEVAVDIGKDGDPAAGAKWVAAFVEDWEEAGIDSVRQTFAEPIMFSTCVLAVATGSNTGEAPTLPPFSEPVFQDLLLNEFYDVGCDSLANLCFDYAHVSPVIRMHLLFYGNFMLTLPSCQPHRGEGASWFRFFLFQRAVLWTLNFFALPSRHSPGLFYDSRKHHA